MYATLGNIHYKAFEQFYRGYKLSVSTALLLFGNQTMATLRSGKLLATDVLGAEKVADALIDVQKYVKFAKYNRFTDAFMRVFRHPEYDHKRMMLKLKQRKILSKNSPLLMITYAYWKESTITQCPVIIQYASFNSACLYC